MISPILTRMTNRRGFIGSLIALIVAPFPTKWYERGTWNASNNCFDAITFTQHTDDSMRLEAKIILDLMPHIYGRGANGY